MNKAILLDGKLLAAQIRSDLKPHVTSFQQAYSRAPSLHVVLVGDQPASAVYVRNKQRAAEEIGLSSYVHRFESSIQENQLTQFVQSLSSDDTVDAILVQLPLPSHIRESAILDAIDPSKDVDGFHPINVGYLGLGRAALIPCTPLGCIHLIDEARRQLNQRGNAFTLAGSHAVVVGRSTIVGKPMAQLLLSHNATVTIAHSKTRNLAAICQQADVLVVAVGHAELIQHTHVKEGAIVIDVGINRASDGKLVGDVHFDSVIHKASAISPVPGGVGPLTIAMVLQNTMLAAQRRR